MKRIVINADGYGLTDGTSRAIEECVEFGTVTSISVNVNFPRAAGLPRFLLRHPRLSVACHLNPVVGRSILPAQEIPTLVGSDGQFLRHDFRRRLRSGIIRRSELHRELRAQIDRTRQLAGDQLDHLDFHMGLENQPAIYPLFLRLAEETGIGRIRTHKYHFGLHHRHPRLAQLAHLISRPSHLPKYLYNLGLRRLAKNRRLGMPDLTFSASYLAEREITPKTYAAVLRHAPPGCLEFIAHPAYADDELRMWARYVTPRERERAALCSEEFRDAIASTGVRLVSYQDVAVPLFGMRHGE